MHTLSNEIVTILINEKGAELTSFIHHATQLNYIWSAQPVWPKTSPVLFPIVGGLKNGQYTYKDKLYKLPRHGFARDLLFNVESKNENTIIFKLNSTEETKKVYPFDFTFKIIYSLQQATLSISFIVENTGNEMMYFSVGAHPAFALPLQKNLIYNDYYLAFNQKETLSRWPINSEGNISNKSIPFLDNAMRLPLEKELFSKDAIVLKNMQSDSITIQSAKGDHGVRVEFNRFPYMGIWAAKNADFICIEPWCGIADHEDASGNLEEKEGIEKLEAHKIFTRTYSITVF